MLKSLTAACLLLMYTTTTGCINLYTRLPFTGTTIETCYQSTDTAAAFALVGSFPQAMNVSGDRGLAWYNIFTVAFIGIPCLADTACEAALDTVFYPADYFMEKSREFK